MSAPAKILDEIEYPDSDGKPMAENTLQFRWIVTVQGNVAGMYRDRDDVFVAGDLLWYPVRGRPKIRQAPDTLVVFGRPPGDRGSYRQWVEGGIAPQVVFEILSPGNTKREMKGKREFYDRYGVSEYYIYDPDDITLEGWIRRGTEFEEIAQTDGWVSPLLQIRFDMSGVELVIWRPDGQRFLTFAELMESREESQRLMDVERQRADNERKRAEKEREKAEKEREKAKRLAARLRTLGLDPDAEE